MIARLLRLAWLERRAALRKFVGGLRSPRRLAGLLFMAGLFGFLIWSTSRARREGVSAGSLSREGLIVFAAMMFLMSLFAGFVQQGPRFTQADVDFLFPAPFGPRLLLLWRLLHLWPLTLLSTLFFAVIFLATRVEHPGRAFAGFVLLQVTALHLQMLISVLLTKVSDAAARRLRRAGKAAALLALIAAMAFIVMEVTRHGGIQPTIAALIESPAMRALVHPAVACGDYVFAASGAAAGFALLDLVLGAAGTLALLLLPEIDFREESVATTARFSRLLASHRRTGVAVEVEEGRRARAAVPAPRALFRASGAIVWKNLLLLVRSWKAVLPSLLLGVLFVLPMVIAMRGMADLGWTALVPIVMLTLFWSNAIGFDLRRELDRLDVLRALPLAPAAVVFAELLVPWSLAVAAQEALVAILSLTGFGNPRSLGLVALALPLLTLLAVLIDNLLVVFFASRASSGVSRGASGHSSAQFLRMIGWAATAAPGIAAGFALHAATGNLALAVALGVAVELALAAALFTLLVRWYRSRDVDAAE